MFTVVQYSASSIWWAIHILRRLIWPIFKNPHPFVTILIVFCNAPPDTLPPPISQSMTWYMDDPLLLLTYWLTNIVLTKYNSLQDSNSVGCLFRKSRSQCFFHMFPVSTTNSGLNPSISYSWVGLHSSKTGSRIENGTPPTYSIAVKSTHNNQVGEKEQRTCMGSIPNSELKS